MPQAKVVKSIPDDAKTSAYDDVPKNSDQAGIPNVIDPALTAYQDCCVSSYIYRSVGNDYQTKVPYGEHIKHFIELNAGAHYYVMSAYSDQYKTASMRVKLSELLCNPAHNRTGYVSLALISTGTRMWQCDIGLAYRLDGAARQGWYASSWAKDHTGTDGIVPEGKPMNFYAKGYDATSKLTSADTVEIVISVKRANGYDYVGGTIYKVSSTGERTVFAMIQYRGLEGEFFEPNLAAPKVRFARFMSLVPNNSNCHTGECSDFADRSKLKGIIRDCKIDGQPWDKSKIAYAWSMQGANIKTLKIGQLTSESIGSDADECEILHTTETHGTPYYITVDP